ncbi:pif1 DNA helicase [Arctopsyche grandis]|uniref:pif1 DNA helicase n=1 Tax=Arctopsyche grandis TaxID=121162 RepID=UPI00406D8136
MEGSCVRCVATLEYEGAAARRVVHRGATIRLVRTASRHLLLSVEPEKGAPVKLNLPATTVHTRFMAEGKASFRFREQACTLLLANAPPSELGCFLKTVFVKSTADTPEKPTSRAILLSKTNALEDISPVTTADLEKAKSKVSKASTTTPSPSGKRKLPDKANKGPVAKKLYAPSPLTTEEVLNDEQKRVLDACLGRCNIFFTGSAGTGKSFLLRKIISALPPDCAMSTASTGVAACHIGGTTLHAFAGIGAGEATIERCVQMASKSAVAQKWKRCKHLIIDEISMVDGKYFEKIEEVARRIRKNEKPFGGIQLILCGDFLQLPPIAKDKEKKRFCFQTEAWERCIQKSFELKTVHRQKDPEFISILNSIRIGRVTKEITDTLTATSQQKIESDGILATRLCSHTNDSNLINESKLKQLEGEQKVYNAEDSEPYSSSMLDSQTVAPSKLTLKEGAQVMLLKNINISAGLVNGARGVVIRFEDGLPVVRFKNSKEYTAKTERWVVKSTSGALLSRRQIPLNLAWAFSIHKSQGLTLDCVEMSLSKIFEAGQAYVALSRAQSLQSLRVLDFDSKQVWANPDVLEFYQKFRRQLLHSEIIPINKFITNKNKTETAVMKAKLKLAKNLSSKPLVNYC